MSTASPSRDMRWLILAIAALVVALDRATKLWIVSHIPSGPCDCDYSESISPDACA